jgi:hypothetical protein
MGYRGAMMKSSAAFRLVEETKLASQTKKITVRADWDSEASVWVAISDDVPGLVLEAPSMDLLVPEIETVIPILLEANGETFTTATGTLDYSIEAHIEGSMPLSAA